ncbi:hypothetical protein H6785_00755 [Candidatus Nomurabacteria bacterium]|nr:hypothetical protein [Candidatus Kaiserbacteria bacterium]MCB9815102.1 hypothetical protein [Candidatus Nomurabacteria bacterium]
MKIGYIGQGFVGKNMSDDFENRGYEVVRYALEPEYKDNATKIADCEIVFIAVPTPTGPAGPNIGIVESVIDLVADRAVVVIKSTILPGSTRQLQEKFPTKTILFSPEFLAEKTAVFDAANPIMNVVGYTQDIEEQKKAAEKVMGVLPHSEHNFVVTAEQAEIQKYAHNIQGYFRIILANLLYEMATHVGADWEPIKNMMDSDVMMSPYYNDPVHKGGRGAGGNCFIKDMAAFRHHYESLLEMDEEGLAVLKALEAKNIELLLASKKNIDLVREVYGLEVMPDEK